MAYWIDNADSYICSICGYECNNPNKEKYGADVCPNCGEKMGGNRMDEYIKRKEIRKAYEKLARSYMHGEPYIADWKLDKMIEELPAADVAPVMHGRWISLTDCSNAGVYCSICHKKVYKEDYAWCNKKNRVRSSYCPNCGARMNERNE
nr:MAG TPA: DNA-directed RNA polymerase [Caudoviricetes sp.]